MSNPEVRWVGIAVFIDVPATQSVKPTDPPRIHFLGRGLYTNIAFEAGQIVAIAVTIGVTVLRRHEWEIVNLRRSVRLVVTPTIVVGVPPLGRIQREVVDALGAESLVVTPPVSVGVKPLGWLQRERI